MTVTASQQLRWSSVRDCGRKAVYEVTGAPHRDRSLKEDRQLARGRSVGRDYLVAIAAESSKTIWVGSGPYSWVPRELRAVSEDEADILAELKIGWELGVGHADGYIRETDTVLEVLSSQHASDAMVRSKLLQARGYAEGLDADNIALVIVDPATLEDERVIVTRTSALWADLTVEMDDRVAQVVEWRDAGTMPGRVCGKPSEARSHFCLYADHCFAGWTAPTPDPLNDEHAETLATQLFHVKNKRREISATDRTLEAEQKELQAEIGERVPAGEWQVGSYRVKRSDRSRSSFKLGLAEKDSRFPDGLLSEFTSRSEYTIYDVDKTDDPALVLADDEAPF